MHKLTAQRTTHTAMAIRAPKSNFINAPEGRHLAVCVDVVDLGMVQTQYGIKDMLRLVFQTEARSDELDGKRFMVSTRMNFTTNEKGRLYKTMKSWFGSRMPDLSRFDFEKLIGQNCELLIVHNPKGDTVYANIETVLPPANGATKMVPEDYTRVQDREGYEQPGAAQPAQQQPAQQQPARAAQPVQQTEFVVDDDLPF